MARVKVKDLNPCTRKPYGVYSRYDEYLNLLLNQIAIKKRTTGEAISAPIELFIKKTLCEDGQVGYSKILDKWYYVYGEGRDDLGNPTTLNLVTANGKSERYPAYYEPSSVGAYLIKGLPTGLSMRSIIKETTDFMSNCDVAMRQNLEACKTPYVVVCKNKDVQLSFEEAIQQKQTGQAVVIVSAELGDGLKAVNIGVDFLVDKFRDARNAERDTLLTKLGIMTAVEKAERVQSAEVNVTLGQATDYIYSLIDTFNKYTTSYDIDYEMYFNGSMEELYEAEENDENVDDKDSNVDVNKIEEDEVITNGN